MKLGKLLICRYSWKSFSPAVLKPDHQIRLLGWCLMAPVLISTSALQKDPANQNVMILFSS
jgi:hypothetical protein